MAGIVLFTSDTATPADVLPGLALLTLDVEVAPLTTSALAMNLDAEALILDGRRDLVSARSLCRAASGAMEAPPILLVLEEGGYAVVAVSWGATDTVLFSAPPAEIQARIRMMSDRAAAEARQEDLDKSTISIGGLSIDSSAFTAHAGDRQLNLTYKEFELLCLLVENRGRTLSRALLLDRVWPDGADFVDENALSVAVKRLRDKLDAARYIKTVYGLGYAWAVNPDA